MKNLIRSKEEQIQKQEAEIARKTHEGVDKIWNMEHPGTSNNYDNYEKKCVKLNFGLADVTIWSAQIGQVT